MKTTIEISDPLFAKAKALARKENTTLRQLVEQGLQQVIREKTKKQEKPFRLKKASVKGGGLTPEAMARGGWAALRDLSYDPDFR
jgi:Bacterial antitoxin of type II TA system, VapB